MLVGKHLYYKSANILQVSRQTFVNVCGLTFEQVCKHLDKVSRQTLYKVCLLTFLLQVCKLFSNVSRQTLVMLVGKHLHYKSANILKVSRQTFVNVCGLTFEQVCKHLDKVSRQT